MFDFNSYQTEVFRQLDKWIGVLKNGNVEAANDLKEATGDLISGWKDNNPRRREEIDTLVNEHMMKRFKEWEEA